MHYEEILDFWIGPLGPEGLGNGKRVERWFKPDPELDRQLKDRFESELVAARSGERDDWLASPRGRLAMVVLLDQFSRNIYRGTPEMFASDDRALQVARSALDRGDDGEHRLEERVFLLMPLMHAEDMSSQNECVRRFEHLHANAGGAAKNTLGNMLYFARRHREIIERFGRYPHRNVILGRTTTAEEAEFLKEKDSSF